MPRQGIVIETRADTALISTSRRGVCGECAQRPSCSFESALGSDASDEVLANNPLGATPGDQVEFDLPDGVELKLSILIWAVPVIGLLAGAIIGSRLSPALSLPENTAALIGAVAGLFISIVPVIVYDRLAANDPRLVPSITKITRTQCKEVDSR